MHASHIPKHAYRVFSSNLHMYFHSNILYWDKLMGRDFVHSLLKGRLFDVAVAFLPVCWA